MEGFQDSGERNLRQVDGYLVVEPGLSSAAELQSTYRAFAVLSIKNRITRALVKAIDTDPAGEHALRDAFTVMLLAGSPRGQEPAAVPRTPQESWRQRNGKPAPLRRAASVPLLRNAHAAPPR